MIFLWSPFGGSSLKFLKFYLSEDTLYIAFFTLTIYLLLVDDANLKRYGVTHLQLGTEMHCELVGSNLHWKLAVM